MAQYLGAGVAACYRGNRPYSSPEIGAMLKNWIGWYKAHRGTLIQPVIHLRRPSMQSWDGWLHVNPFSLGDSQSEVGVAMLFNPTDQTLQNMSIALPLYYTGLEDNALVTVNDLAPRVFPLNRDYSITLTLDMPPRSIHTVVVESSGTVK